MLAGHLLAKSISLNSSRCSQLRSLLMFILYGLYSFVKSSGPVFKKLADSILASCARFIASILTLSLSKLRLSFSSRITSLLTLLLGLGELAPLVCPL